MGGTFDPIHHGHLVAASEVADRFTLDEVIFVPTGQPWQKSAKVVSPAEDRYLMTVVATASNPRFSVSRVDIDRAGPTYTADTLTDLNARYPDSKLYFITGADALAQILSWHKVDALFELAHFVGVTRPGYELAERAPARRAPSRSWRCPRWRSRPPTAATASPSAGRSGTSCPTVSSSTSPSATSTATLRPDQQVRKLRRTPPPWTSNVGGVAPHAVGPGSRSPRCGGRTASRVSCWRTCSSGLGSRRF